nr:immunoglobulin heavy chain junction region [Macaca mulatta]MPN84064.1 immunoglobulin heavy chain junction region [Macaca mulatta]MPN84523.1 immunoglobulin heavy chain junction region [Macaca mulatta]MPN84524.1 immunoglobulin heavy chain junction region [Macaca mulatta]MPN84624.1 immunoglobulin heavy chain junction region [Macaca mulatta]
CCREDYW